MHSIICKSLSKNRFDKAMKKWLALHKDGCTQLLTRFAWNSETTEERTRISAKGAATSHCAGWWCNQAEAYDDYAWKSSRPKKCSWRKNDGLLWANARRNAFLCEYRSLSFSTIDPDRAVEKETHRRYFVNQAPKFRWASRVSAAKCCGIKYEESCHHWWRLAGLISSILLTARVLLLRWSKRVYPFHRRVASTFLNEVIPF